MNITSYGAICIRCGHMEPVDLSRAHVDQSVKGDTYRSSSGDQDFKQCVSRDILDAVGLEYLVY
jgi:hypothetical protein